jgi:hypothetical protein
MTQERMRLVGGPLNGRAVWVEHDRMSLNVQVARGGNLGTQTLTYRREGGMLVFVAPDAVDSALEAP